jgi:hypothetical protein
MKIVCRILSGATAGQVFELDATSVIRFGRRPDNDVPFDAHQDLDVSGYHADIREAVDGYYLHDLESANGTFVGGMRVEKLRLASEQEVSFGLNGPRIHLSLKPGLSLVEPQPPVATATPAPVATPVAAATPAASVDIPSTGQAIASEMGAEKKVGANTVAMMIDAALLKSRAGKGGKVGKSTVFLRSMINQSVTRSTRRFRVVAILLVALLVGTVAGFLLLRHFEKQESEESTALLRKQMASLMKEQGSASSSGEKKLLAKKLLELNKELQASSPLFAGKKIAQNFEKAIFLIAMKRKGGEGRGYCTAFAIRSKVLATNAHCIKALDKFAAKGLSSFVVMNNHPTKRYEIRKSVAHPSYHKPRGTISRDVGLLYLKKAVPVTVILGAEKEFYSLGSGDVMYTYGFPGRLARVSSPAATLVQGVIGRVTRLDGDIGDKRANKLIQHSAFTSGGTSGSPIFNTAGNVVAINAGGYVEPGSLQVMSPDTGKKKEMRVAQKLAGYNFGIRIDVLGELMARQGISQ